MQSKIKSFDQMWEDGEKVSSKLYKDQPLSTLTKEINDLFINYEQVDSSNLLPEMKRSLKKKIFGELLFIASTISYRDDINIYAAF